MSETIQSQMRIEPGKAWGWVLTSGILSTLLGLIFLASSINTDDLLPQWLLAIWIGVSFLLTGVQRLVLATVDEEYRGWAIVSGVLLLILALITFMWPEETLLVLVSLAGIAAVIAGVLDLIVGISGKATDRTIAIVRGLLALGIGLAMLVWTPEAVWVIAVLFGAFLLLQGIFTIVMAFALRRMRDELEEDYGVKGGVVTVTTRRDDEGNLSQEVDVEPIPADPKPPRQVGTDYPNVPPQVQPNVEAPSESSSESPAEPESGEGGSTPPKGSGS